jgi:hypothetical protein
MSDNESNSAYGSPATNVTIDSFNLNNPTWSTAVDIITNLEKGITMEDESPHS